MATRPRASAPVIGSSPEPRPNPIVGPPVGTEVVLTLRATVQAHPTTKTLRQYVVPYPGGKDPLITLSAKQVDLGAEHVEVVRPPLPTFLAGAVVQVPDRLPFLRREVRGRLSWLPSVPGIDEHEAKDLVAAAWREGTLTIHIDRRDEIPTRGK